MGSTRVLGALAQMGRQHQLQYAKLTKTMAAYRMIQPRSVPVSCTGRWHMPLAYRYA